MEIDTTTFILELLNFVVLVWLLNRFLFRPVMAVMDQRRQALQQAAQAAADDRQKAEALREQYETRLESWAQEKEAARAGLNRELAEARAQALEQTRKAVEAERQQMAAQDEGKRQAWQKNAEHHALQIGMQFAARLLQRLSGPQLDGKLVDIVLEDLAGWPATRREALKAALAGSAGQVRLITARALPAEALQKLTAALTTLAGTAVHINQETDAALISGLRLVAGPWAVQASIADELEYFTQDQAA